MFRLVTANDATRLANALGESLCGQRDDPLAPARVLVPQAGLQRWLQVHLAEEFGVIANVEFTPPAAFAWELLRAHRPDTPERSPFAPEVARWHLHALLDPARAELPPHLRDYLQRGDDPLRRYALAGELARVYERMQGYRRDTLARWEAGRDDDWMAVLWRQLLQRTDGISRAARVDAWLSAFDPEYVHVAFHDKPAPPGLPARLACFACANVSPDVLRMLAVAGQHCEMDFYLPLPSMAYLGDLPRTRAAVRERMGERNGENPLLVSLGGAAAEFIELLYGYEHVQPDAEIERFDPDIARDTLLGRVRDDILQHAAPDVSERMSIVDGSLQFHACHTALREVQTLHDTLLALFEKFPDLQPRDVAVMMPDVAACRPAIEAVFGGVDRGDARFIPYNLGDLGAAAQHPAAELFLKLLDAPASRWELDELADVLAAPGVLRRFDLDSDALERLRARLREAGARWGEDEHARERAGAGDYREFSWAFAIDRIVAGFAAGDVENALLGDTAPLPGIEGQAFAHLDAALALTETWRRLREESRRARPASAWQKLLNEVFDSLYQPDPNDLAETRALERVRAALAQLAADCAEADPALDLPWSDLRVHLRDALAASDPAQRLFTGGVTFCGMVPLRVVPFRVICLLGMHEDAFPRREPGGLDPLATDRRNGHARHGDRNVRADDRLLFLQLLAAARDVFYVSWVGRDAQSNKDLPPAAMVTELMQLLRTGYLADGVGADGLPCKQPLHPFSAELFRSDAPRSYATQWLPAARTRMRGDATPPVFCGDALTVPMFPAETTLDELKRFLENPSRGFLERALRMRLPRDVDAEADLEPLQPDHALLRYRLTRAVLDHGDAAGEEQKVLFAACGLLPPGALADAALAIARQRAALLREQRDAFTQKASPGRCQGAFELSDGLRLVGTVGDVYPAGLLRADPGQLNGKRVLRAWIDTLFVAALRGEDLGCRLLWLEKAKAHAVVKCADFVPVAPDAARELLGDMIDLMHTGMRRPLPLLAGASWQSLKRERTRDGEAGPGEFAELLRKAAAKADDDSDLQDRSDFDDAAVRIAWRGVDLANADSLDDWYRIAAWAFPRFVGVPVKHGDPT
ncbi:MAG: exodeoxyribonuclease V subunit gamma [Rhodanobacteraceae bacterium]|nr:MAG: exodeoxyribonuclease V subunit gamma [Rhodanobacteraceae bacterium]